MENETSTPKKTTTRRAVKWSEQAWYQNCMAVMPFVRWAAVIISLALGYYVYQRDVNAAQAVNVTQLKADQDTLKRTVELNRTEREKQFDEMEKKLDKMLTRELYEAYHATDQEKFDRLEKLLTQLLSR
jgi:hypothetical protein